MRISMRRFAHLTNTFSKKLGKHIAALASIRGELFRRAFRLARMSKKLVLRVSNMDLFALLRGIGRELWPNYGQLGESAADSIRAQVPILRRRARTK